VSAARLDQLRGEGILGLDHGAYRAGDIALYSGYQLLSPPPIPALRNIPDESLTSTRISTDKRSV